MTFLTNFIYLDFITDILSSVVGYLVQWIVIPFVEVVFLPMVFGVLFVAWVVWITIVKIIAGGTIDVFINFNDVFSKFTFFDTLYNGILAAAFGIFVLIVMFQTFKSLFAYLGFEADEPWKIAFRAVIFGFMIFYAKDICQQVIYWFNYILTNYIMGGKSLETSLSDMISGFWCGDWASLLTPSESSMTGYQLNGVISAMNTGAYILETPLRYCLYILAGFYITFKLCFIGMKFSMRLILALFLSLVSPLAFACGVAKSTKPYLGGWIKVFTGNMLVLMFQIIAFLCLVYFMKNGDIGNFNHIISTTGTTGQLTSNALESLGIPGCILAIGFCKLIDKIEELARDASIGTGIGTGEMMTPMQATGQIAQGIYQISSINNLIANPQGALGIDKLAGKFGGGGGGDSPGGGGGVEVGASKKTGTDTGSSTTENNPDVLFPKK